MKIQLDEGYQFGLGAFETIAIEKGKPIFLEKHLKRLERAIEFLEISESVQMQLKLESGEDISRGLQKVITEYLNHMKETEKQALKIMVSKGNVLCTDRQNPYDEKRYQKGFSVEFSRIRRNETSPLVFHKTMNYGDCILEKRRASRQGIDEIFFLNTKNEISEGTTTNVFFVKEGEIYTPVISSGLLPGIMRQYLIENYPIIEKAVLPSELNQFEECFVTNSLLGIMPVKNIGDCFFYKRKTSEKLRREYFDKIGI